MPDDKNMKEHAELAGNGYKRALDVLRSGEYSIVVLDEIVTVNFFGLLSIEEILELIKSKKAGTELVLTGRGATEKLIGYCDLVTEMKEIKHYYSEGIKARKGIEH
jgi:cob(I)alamin adenosyltransferase